MEVQILSKKLITPSFQTPNHHDHDHPKSIKFSCIDQFAPPVYVQLIFYYAAADHGGTSEANHKINVQERRLQRMEKSLADALGVFYPLGGRSVEEDQSIDCNDKGMEYLEAQVKGKLSELLQDHRSNAKLQSQFTPQNYPRHSSTTPLLSIQVNIFECGGLAIGLNISHIVADAYTVSLFTNAWATACRAGINEVVPPSFDSPSIFPPIMRDMSLEFKPQTSPPRVVSLGDIIVTRRFVFNGKAISRLKAIAMSAREGDAATDDDIAMAPSQPSRLQVLTALIWRTLIRITQAKRGHLRASLMTHAFNLRGKTSQPITENSCGNLWRLVLARFTPKHESKMELQDLVGLVRESMRNVATESAKLSLDQGDHDMLLTVIRNAWREVYEYDESNEADVYHFTSWCRFSYYDVDFGWGKPSWVSSTYGPVDGFIVFLDTKYGDGIDAWVSLDEEKMLLFEQDHDIIASTTAMED